MFDYPAAAVEYLVDVSVRALLLAGFGGAGAALLARTQRKSQTSCVDGRAVCDAAAAGFTAGDACGVTAAQ